MINNGHVMFDKYLKYTLPVVLHTKEVLATGKQSLASLPKSSAKSTLGVVAVSVGR